MSRILASLTLALAGTVLMAGCSSSSSGEVNAHDHTTHAHDSMSMADAAGDGLAPSKDGYELKVVTTALAANESTDLRFSISNAGTPVTAFAADQTKLLHLYMIRSDFTGFQHVHPTIDTQGTWTAALTALAPGQWRVYASFKPGSGPGKDRPFVLSQQVEVLGAPQLATFAAPATSTTVDGYTVQVTGKAMAGMTHPLTVNITRGAQPVTTLEPYLESYAHLSAFAQKDGAFAHLHPAENASTAPGGPTLTFDAQLPTSGLWRVFVQFQIAGVLHTAPITIQVT